MFDTSVRTEGVWLEVDEDDEVENGATLRILPSGGRENVIDFSKADTLMLSPRDKNEAPYVHTYIKYPQFFYPDSRPPIRHRLAWKLFRHLRVPRLRTCCLRREQCLLQASSAWKPPRRQQRLLVLTTKLKPTRRSRREWLQPAPALKSALLGRILIRGKYFSGTFSLYVF